MTAPCPPRDPCPWCGGEPCIGYYCPGHTDPDYGSDPPRAGWDELRGYFKDPVTGELWEEQP